VGGCAFRPHTTHRVYGETELKPAKLAVSTGFTGGSIGLFARWTLGITYAVVGSRSGRTARAPQHLTGLRWVGKALLARRADCDAFIFTGSNIFRFGRG